jgi:biopolymer transport protein TolQ
MINYLQSPYPIGGIGFAFGESNLSGQVIVGILFMGSILVWSIMITKIHELLVAKRRCERFLRHYRGTTNPMGTRLDERKADCPLAVVHDAACATLEAVVDPTRQPSQALHLSSRQAKAIGNAVERTVAEQALQLENWMGFLALGSSTAPFLGLLGTVWGVMEAFGGIDHNTATLSAVAPGISGALLTTVVGLLVALPSSIGYNLLGDRIRKLIVMMDNFGQELTGDFEQFTME